MKQGGPLKRKPWRKKRDGRDWERMGTNAYNNAGGRCEWCGRPVPLGMAPAHIIPRDINRPELDQDWNLAHLGYVKLGDIGCTCHSRFDSNRARAIRQMVADGGCPLLRRIATDPRLKSYFELLESKLQYIEATGGGGDEST